MLQGDIANSNVLRGDATELKHLSSHRDEVTILGGFGVWKR
jgi:hypothetical protein